MVVCINEVILSQIWIWFGHLCTCRKLLLGQNLSIFFCYDLILMAALFSIFFLFSSSAIMVFGFGTSLPSTMLWNSSLN